MFGYGYILRSRSLFGCGYILWSRSVFGCGYILSQCLWLHFAESLSV